MNKKYLNDQLTDMKTGENIIDYKKFSIFYRGVHFKINPNYVFYNIFL